MKLETEYGNPMQAVERRIPSNYTRDSYLPGVQDFLEI
jgi:hypothetical protein